MTGGNVLKLKTKPNLAFIRWLLKHLCSQVEYSPAWGKPSNGDKFF